MLLLALTLASGLSPSWQLTGGVLGTVAAVALAQIAPTPLLVAVPAVSIGALVAAQAPLPAAADAVLRTQLSGLAMGLLARRGMPPLVAIAGGALPTIAPEIGRFLAGQGSALLIPDPGEIDRSVSMTLDVYRKLRIPEDQLARSEEMLRRAAAILVSLVPAFQFLGMMAVFFLIYLASQGLLARLGLAIRPIVRFPLWKLSHWYVWIFSAGLFAVLMPGASAQVAGRNILFVMVMAYFIQGLSVTQFLMVRRGLGLLMRLFIYGIGMIAVLPFFAAMTTGIGLFDTWFDFRGLEPRDADEKDDAPERGE